MSRHDVTNKTKTKTNTKIKTMKKTFREHTERHKRLLTFETFGILFQKIAFVNGQK